MRPLPVTLPAAATTPPRLITLILMSAVAIGTLTLFLPSLPQIAAEFEADFAVVNLAIAGYAVMTALFQLTFGPLSDGYGRRPVVLIALLVYIVASLGCALATDVWTFLAFRMLQGSVIAGYVISSAAIRDTSSASGAASKLGVVAMAWSLAPMLGPMIGGLVDEMFGWRANFLLYAACGVGVAALVWIDLGETNTSRADTFAAQFRSYPELFRARRFWGYTLCLAFSVSTFYAYLGGASIVATAMFELSTAELGFWLGTITAGFFFGNFISARYAERFGTVLHHDGRTDRLLRRHGAWRGVVLRRLR